MTAAAIGGLLNAGGFPALGWWPLIFVGTAMILWSLRGRSIGGSLLVGLVAGFVFFGSHIFWLTVYLGPIPWLALAGLQSIFFALGAMLMSLAWRFVPLVWAGRTGRLIARPVAASHTCAVLSQLAVTILVPPGLKVALMINC